MSSTHPLVVIGGAFVDVRAVAGASASAGESSPGHVRVTPGGAGRNVATNLARLGWTVTLLTSVGDDPFGRYVLDSTAAAGVDVSHVAMGSDPTGLFVSAGPAGGEPWCVATATAVESLRLSGCASWLPVIERAAMVLVDANLESEFLQAVSVAAHGRPRVLLMVSARKVPRLRPILDGAAAVIGHEREARALTGLPPTAAWDVLGSALVQAGVDRVVLTAGARGLWVITRAEQVHQAALPVEAIDPLGAGDAVAAAVVHGLLTDLAPGPAAALAARTAALVVASHDSTPAALRDAVA